MNIDDGAILCAGAFAAGAHQAVGQVRKYTGEPYHFHCREVAQLVAKVPGISVEAICAAYLHDSIEDTEVTAEAIEDIFGIHVAALVLEVTDISTPEDGNRAARKAIDCEHLAHASAEGQTIKLADMISNTRSIVERDPEFARVYLAEKRRLLGVLTKGDAGLFAQAQQILLNGERTLGL